MADRIAKTEVEGAIVDLLFSTICHARIDGVDKGAEPHYVILVLDVTEGKDSA